MRVGTFFPDADHHAPTVVPLGRSRIKICSGTTVFFASYRARRTAVAFL